MAKNHVAFVQCETLPCYYHGSAQPLTQVGATQDDEGFVLYLSASANLARRYGPYVTRFTLLPSKLVVLALRDWGATASPEEETADAIVVLGDADCYDFQADMLAVKNPAVLQFQEVLSPAQLALHDDGLPVLQEPAGPADRGWSVWVKDRHSGSLPDALAEVGWSIEDGATYRLSLLPDLAERQWNVRVYHCGANAPLGFDWLSEDSWLIESDFGEMGAADSLNDALVTADKWSRERRRCREASRRPGAPQSHTFEAESAAGSIPF